MTMRFSWKDIQLRLNAQGDELPRTFVLVLHKDEVAPNPASTKHDIYGPATVTYTEHSDGGIDTKIETPPST